MRRISMTTALMLTFALAVAGCGSSNDDEPTADPIAAANVVNEADFPKTDDDKSLEDLQREVSAGQDANLVPAANNFPAGRESRLPFGLFDAERKPFWGPTMMYLSVDGGPAEGPFAVKAHGFEIAEQFVSDTSRGDIDSIGNGYYTTLLPDEKAGAKLNVLTLTQTDGGFQAAATGVTIARSDPTPAPGEKVPAIETRTLDADGGNAAEIDTRQPPSGMQAISLDDALKNDKPTVLIFATPKLCASRVCSPIVDVALEVQNEYGDRVNFIHNEIYNDNDLNKGERPEVLEFGLPMEPYSFVIGADGRVVEQLVGPFDQAELSAAIDQALAKS
jgi:hypothetical protein